MSKKKRNLNSIQFKEDNLKDLEKFLLKGWVIWTCNECKGISVKEEASKENLCGDCKLRNFFEKDKRSFKEKSRKEIENLSRNYFKNLNLEKKEISISSDKIFRIYYDFETSNIYEMKGYVIYWSAVCCHGLQENGADIKSWLKFLEFLYKQRREIILYAHNGIKFDFSFYWRKIIESNLDEKNPETIKKNSLKVLGNWVGLKWKNILHIDSFQFFSFSLDDWPCSENQKKIKLGKYDIFTSKDYLDFDIKEIWYQKLAIYCDNDVDIMRYNMEEFYEKTKSIIGKISKKENNDKVKIYKKFTKSSISLYLARKMIERDKKGIFSHYFPNFSQDKFKDRREFWHLGYQGGCVDVWGKRKITKQKINIYDKVSMYPSNMHGEKMPIGIGHWVNSITNIKEIKDVAMYEIHIKFLKLKTDICKIPLIYLTNEEGVEEAQSEVKEQIFYCVGLKWKFIQKYYEGEWRIIRGLEHESKKDIFDKYIDYFFQEKTNCKEKGDVLGYETNKAFLNSFYGRFGLKSKRNYYLKNRGKNPFEGMPKFLSPKTKKYFQWALTNEENTPSFSYVPVSAVTSARSWVVLMSTVILNQDLAIYWDTDSVFVLDNIKLPKNEKIGSNLGNWELKDQISNYECDASKWYSYLDSKSIKRFKAKGLKKESKEFLSWEGDHEITPFRELVRTENGVMFTRKDLTKPDYQANSKRRVVKGVWLATNRILPANPNYCDFE